MQKIIEVFKILTVFLKKRKKRKKKRKENSNFDELQRKFALEYGKSMSVLIQKANLTNDRNHGVAGPCVFCAQTSKVRWPHYETFGWKVKCLHTYIHLSSDISHYPCLYPYFSTLFFFF